MNVEWIETETDYKLPPMWGEMSDEQRSAWYTRRRVYRRAIRQETTSFGKKHGRAVEEAKRVNTDEYKYDS